MALQGTLDTFGLPDVLRLLASTHKTGRLAVTADRGAGALWLDQGSLVGGEASGTSAVDDMVRVVFELLRYRTGEFAFDAGEVDVSTDTRRDIDEVVSAAERSLEEWRAIEALVPSLDVWVALVAELPAPELVIGAELWRTLVAIGAGSTVGDVGVVLGFGEVETCQAVADLVVSGLAEVSEVTSEEVVSRQEPPVEVDEVGEPVTEPPVATDEAPPDVIDEPVDEDRGPIPEPAVAVSWATEDPPAWAPEPVVEAVEPGAEPDTAHGRWAAQRSMGIDIPGLPSLSATWDPEPATDASMGNEEVSVELGPLTPMAARAIAMAAQASSEAEREAAIQQAIEANDQPLDRGVLLRFLSSVRG